MPQAAASFGQSATVQGNLGRFTQDERNRLLVAIECVEAQEALDTAIQVYALTEIAKASREDLAEATEQLDDAFDRFAIASAILG
jgi:hypothetical protein